MGEELISVIIPTYNRASTIKRSIDSVLNQTYSNIEIIIVDDGSSDNTSEIIANYRNEKIRYYKTEKNLGACAARNKGIELARGYYIAFQDSDDEWFSDKLEKQIKKIKETNTKINFCAFHRNLNNGERIDRIPNIDKNIYEIENLTLELLKGNFISTQTILGEKEIFKQIKFDEKLPRFQDWDLVIRLSKIYRISYVDEVLVNLYIQKDSISMDLSKKIKAFEIICNKYSKEIQNNYELKELFEKKYMTAKYYNESLSVEELKEKLKLKFDKKIFLYYITCITKTDKLIIKILKKMRKGKI